MERMKPQRCLPACRLRLPPALPAKPTFDFYFGSRQHGTWEGAEQPHSCSPATSGAGALHREGTPGIQRKSLASPPGTQRPQGSSPREGWHVGRSGVGKQGAGPPKSKGHSFLVSRAFALSLLLWKRRERELISFCLPPCSSLCRPTSTLGTSRVHW